MIDMMNLLLDVNTMHKTIVLKSRCVYLFMTMWYYKIPNPKRVMSTSKRG